jgi:hypothetical protein
VKRNLSRIWVLSLGIKAEGSARADDQKVKSSVLKRSLIGILDTKAQCDVQCSCLMDLLHEILVLAFKGIVVYLYIFPPPHPVQVFLPTQPKYHAQRPSSS